MQIENPGKWPRRHLPCSPGCRALSGIDSSGSVTHPRSGAQPGGSRSDFLRNRGFSKTETARIIDNVRVEEGRKPESIFDFVQGITAVARQAPPGCAARSGRLISGMREEIVEDVGGAEKDGDSQSGPQSGNLEAPPPEALRVTLACRRVSDVTYSAGHESGPPWCLSPAYADADTASDSVSLRVVHPHLIVTGCEQADGFGNRHRGVEAELDPCAARA